MASTTKNHSPRSVRFGLSDGEIHAVMSRNLADVVLAIDHGSGFSFVDDLGFISEVQGPFFDPRDIGRNPREAMSRVTAQIAPHEEQGDEFGIVLPHAAGVEQAGAESL